MLHIPGATPQSTTTVTLYFFARPSSKKASSGKKEMSMQFLFDSITAFNTSNPKKPGTAPITRSNGEMTLFTSSVLLKSQGMVLIPNDVSIDFNTSLLKSAHV